MDEFENNVGKASHVGKLWLCYIDDVFCIWDLGLKKALILRCLGGEHKE